jgi:hypothetical protein
LQKTKLLKQLQKKDNTISGIQRAFMYPKYRKEMKKRQLLSNQEAKVSVSQANINDIEQMQAMLNPNNSFIDGIKDTIYEIKKSHYKRKMNRAAEILNVMQKCDSPILMRGAAPIVISKRLKDKFAVKLQKDQMLLDAAKNNVQSQNMIAATAK